MYTLRTPAALAFVLVTVATVVVLWGRMEQAFAHRWVLAQHAADAAAQQPLGVASFQPTPAATAAPKRAPALPTVRSSPIKPVLIPTPVPPTATALPTPPPASSYQAARNAVALRGFSHMWQTWNNCGPATLAMNLSYFGSTLDQADVGAVLRHDPDDKNVSPEELVEFARSQGYQAQMRVNGSADLMRLLLSNGIPVLIETWLEPEPNDGMGHYRLLTGYDDAAQYWIGYDSYVSVNLINPNGDYQGIRMPYQETDMLWSVFNRTYLLIYTDAQAPTVAAIFGAALDEQVMWQQTLQQAEAVVKQWPNNAYGWFNLGSSRTALGDYAGAAQAFDRARQLGLPWRMLWYQFGPFQAYYAVGRAQDVVALADATLVNTKSIEELHYWRGQGLAALGQWDEARRAWQRALALNPDYAPAQAALAAAP
ncbi:MAG: tetratricopeptide repeat protein [Caldilineaceae bacterium]